MQRIFAKLHTLIRRWSQGAAAKKCVNFGQPSGNIETFFFEKVAAVMVVGVNS
jgi:hypothetical protein